MGREWAEARMAGPGVLPFAKEYQQQPLSSSSSSWYPMTTHVEQHPNNPRAYYPVFGDMPIEELHNNHTVHHQSHLPHSSQVSTSSFDIAAATASFHMMNAMMPHWHDANNHNYCGCTNTTSSDMSGFGNIY